MLKVGLTGGIGSGKTLISTIFSYLGIPVFNADNEARKIINTDTEVVCSLKAGLGMDIYNKTGIDKNKLASIIFNDPKTLQKVNSIVHPKVHEYFKKWIEKKKSAKYVIEEAAILFESGTYKKLDITINVHADKLIRIDRVVKRDNINSEAVENRIKNQLSDEERIELADFTIFNNGKQMVLPQVIEIHNKILKRIE